MVKPVQQAADTTSTNVLKPKFDVGLVIDENIKGSSVYVTNDLALKYKLGYGSENGVNVWGSAGLGTQAVYIAEAIPKYTNYGPVVEGGIVYNPSTEGFSAKLTGSSNYGFVPNTRTIANSGYQLDASLGKTTILEKSTNPAEPNMQSYAGGFVNVSNNRFFPQVNTKSIGFEYDVTQPSPFKLPGSMTAGFKLSADVYDQTKKVRPGIQTRIAFNF